MVKGPGDGIIWLFFHEHMVMWDKAIKHFKILACLAQAPNQSHWFKGSYISFPNLSNIMFADEKNNNGTATQSSSNKTNFFVPTSTEISVSHILRVRMILVYFFHKFFQNFLQGLNS